MRFLRRFVRLLGAYRPVFRLRQYDQPPTAPPAPRGYIENIDDRGEIFYRDSGPETAIRGTVLLLHGWLVNADINWAMAYSPLIADGYRVIAVDHRGHGRGLRSTHEFTLQDAADDAAAVVRHVQAAPVTVAGYSMGGAIAQLIARDHADVVRGVILGATALQWQDPRWVRVSWRLMALLQFMLRVFPAHVYEWGTRGIPVGTPGLAHWLMAELQRGDARAVADAGRELSRFDSRPWFGRLDVPVVVLLTAQDKLVPPSSQHQIAEYARNPRVIEVQGDHIGAMSTPGVFTQGLIEALHDIEARTSPVAAAVGEVVRMPARGSLPVERGA